MTKIKMKAIYAGCSSTSYTSIYFKCALYTFFKFYRLYEAVFVQHAIVYIIRTVYDVRGINMFYFIKGKFIQKYSI